MIISLSMWPKGRRPNTTGSRTAPAPFVTDSQWNLIKHLFENPDPSPLGGRPRSDPRPCLEGVLFVLKTGCQWKYLPNWYPSSTTCWRRLKEWTESGVLLEAWKILLQHLDGRKLLTWSHAIGDGTFLPAKKGVPTLVTVSVAREPASILLVDGKGLPLSAITTPASSAEVNTIETLADLQVAGQRPKKLLYDKAADADWLRESLATVFRQADSRSSRRLS